MDRVVLMLLDFRPNQTRTFEKFLARFAEVLKTKGWTTEFVFSGEPSREFGRKLSDVGANWRTAAFPLTRKGVEELTTNLRVRPAAMLTVFMSPFNLNLVRLRKKLKVRNWVVYDQTSGAFSDKAWPKKQLAKLRQWYFGRQINRALAVSEFVARRDRQYLSPGKVQVVYNGVDLSSFTPRPSTEDDEPLVVGYIGQLIPEKGVTTLLKAVRLLRDTPGIPSFVVRVAGSGHSEHELRAFCAEHGLTNVEFLGQISDVLPFYSMSTVVVVPSEWEEACAFVIVEALAAGACLLVSDAGGNPELVGLNEECGAIFRRGNAESLAQKLGTLLQDSGLRRKRRLLARQRAEKTFSLEGMVERAVSGFLESTTEPCSPNR